MNRHCADPSRDRLLPLLEEAATRAFAIDNADAGVWRLRARGLAWQWRWDAALEAFNRAERLDPHRAGIVVEHAYLVRWMGRPAEAIAVSQRAEDLDINRVFTPGILRMRCRCHIMLSRIDEAVAEYERALAGDDSWPTHAYLAAAHALKGERHLGRSGESGAIQTQPLQSSSPSADATPTSRRSGNRANEPCLQGCARRACPSSEIRRASAPRRPSR